MTFDGLDQLARGLAASVLNGLWQGLAVTALAWLAVRILGRSSAVTRYWIWSATLAAVVALLFLPAGGVASFSHSAAPRPAPLHLSSTWPLWLLGGWCAGVLLMLGRLAWSYGYVRWLAHTASALGGGIYRSNETSVPVTIGLLHPAVLIPQALLDCLSAPELEQIILHERAHLRRGDHWSNLAHELIKALFFFHPAVWWIAGRLNLEREIACDDDVVRATGMPVEYAGCLAKVAELSSCPPAALASAAVGNGKDIFHRVERLVAWDRHLAFSRPGFAMAMAMLVVAAALAPRMPALVGIDAPARLVLAPPRPAIELHRRNLIAEERLRYAGALLETAERRMETASRALRTANSRLARANRVMRLAALFAPGDDTVLMPRVSCVEPARPSKPPLKLNKI